MGGTLVLPSFERDFGLENISQSTSDNLSSNILSCFQGGMFVGALASHPLSDRWGRRICMFIAIVVFLIGASVQTASAGSTGVIMAGRAIAGLGIGTACPVIPV